MFCQAIAANLGGAEAARRAGYSPNGAKQRGAHLMGQPAIRVRVDQLRRARSDLHQADLDDAAEVVELIIFEALEKKSLSLALRAVELRLKLRGVIMDKRIPHHHAGAVKHPDADYEDLDFDPSEDDDVPLDQPHAMAEEAEMVTLDSDLKPNRRLAPSPAPVPSFRPNRKQRRAALHENQSKKNQPENGRTRIPVAARR
ncbi:hypothetical protein N825_06290 [Skermanella stibiiresistens SB22]|uniref:Terminase n=1 Tax=Skermanella stibiiresistens SB22 TaxID=1385369 RepID=W9H428_9PROT|nr:hypothetical protein N825_06290 [Skermanella stibiiresistens SB22]